MQNKSELFVIQFYIPGEFFFGGRALYEDSINGVTEPVMLARNDPGIKTMSYACAEKISLFLRCGEYGMTNIIVAATEAVPEVLAVPEANLPDEIRRVWGDLPPSAEWMIEDLREYEEWCAHG